MSTIRKENGQVLLAADAARRLVFEIFLRAGCCREEADRIAFRLVEANLRGHESHGIIRTARYVQWLGDGTLRANQSITIERENDVLAIIDGGFGFGQTIGEETVDVGVAKAKRHGVAVTALKNSGHLGCIGDWALRAAESDVASVHFVNVRGSLLVAPFGGIDRRSGTSPFCCGVPVPGGDPIILDFATSLVAEGKALVALRGGAPLADDALVGPEGSFTNDPRLLYGRSGEGLYPNPNKGPGALTAFGLHKGSGLNFIIEILAGALTGSGTAGALNEPKLRHLCNGMLSIYLAVEFFASDDWFAQEVRSYIDFFKSAAPITADGEVLIPGETEMRWKAKCLETGLPLAEGAWADILRAAHHVGMTDEDIDQALAASVAQRG